MKRPAVSIIIPFYNEEESLPHLFIKVRSIPASLRYEVIFVDDGSTDRSFSLVKKLIDGHQSLRLIRLRRNFGQTSAIAAGISKAQGKILVMMDADLQNDPGDIPLLLGKINQGFDVVSGWRRQRNDDVFTRKIPSYIANRLISLVTGIKLNDYGCALKAYRREVLINVSLYGEMHRFLPAICAWNGAEIAEVEISHYPRMYGKSKYGLIRILKVILDLITVKFLGSYLTKPIYVFGGLGLFAMFTGLVVVGYLLYAKLYVAHFFIIQSPLLLLSVFLEIVGVMLVMMGLLAEILVRIYYESQGEKPYTIKQMLGF